ncbi:MAG: membrane protein insertase YidC [Termitinemataceae bacterium]|nr:MAG: membrane protein insertase YidC [Termitinemataceae bacterium]
MEKKTVLAIVLSIVVIIVYYSAMQIFFPPAPPSQTESTAQSLPSPANNTEAATPPAVNTAAAKNEKNEVYAVEDEALNSDAEYVEVETDLLRIKLSSAGGDIVSFKLKEHKDGDELVDMLLSGNAEPHAFTITLGGKTLNPLHDVFKVKRESPYIVSFTRSYSSGDSVFTLTKKYTFVQGEYMFELDVVLDGAGTPPALNFAGDTGNIAYTLGFGPQIGPKFKTLNDREEYRHYWTYTNGKRRDEKPGASNDAVTSAVISWAAIAGKYFAFIAVPDATHYGYIFSTRNAEEGLGSASRLYIERPVILSSLQTDTFRFYLGPKTSSTLEIYETNKSYWKDLNNLNLSSAANTSGFWAILNPLEWLLKKLLTLFFSIIPNYGVAIILVTLIVKLILFPLTKKSSEGTLRMQSIAPKIKELQAKYKENPAKLNAEMAALYKKEGYNPMSGCLPILIQIPIFFAMYNLFNNHFDLRGAVFIPNWIPDLSQPEFIYSFAPLKLPLLGWSELRALPFLYVGSQLLYGKVTQTPDQKGNMQMKMMLYAMPVIFFFVLYNVPSGLLVYWIMSNVLTMIQQLAINKYLAKKKTEQLLKEESGRKVIAPPKKNKKKRS